MKPGAEKTLETLVANYNMPDDWNQIMGVALTTKGMRDIDYVYMGRLMFLQNAKITPSDASLVGSTASRLGFLGEAAQAQKLGGTGFADPGPKIDADKKTFAQQVAAGPKQNGVYNVKTAEAAYGYGMFPEAEALAKAAKDQRRRAGHHRAGHGARHGTGGAEQICRSRADLRRDQPAQPGFGARGHGCGAITPRSKPILPPPTDGIDRCGARAIAPRFHCDRALA